MKTPAQTTLGLSYAKALAWIKANTIDEQGIVVSAKQRCPYLEVTGYLIPTLMDAGEHGLAYQYAEFLSYMQRPNGSFAGPDGQEYIFDSGQALRGLVRAAARWEQFGPCARKCADYLTMSMRPNGQLPATYQGDIPEAVHVFVLPALLEAARVLNQPHYKEAALRSTQYYKNLPQVLNKDHLTHFYAYILDGFIDMGEAQFVLEAVQEVFRRQKSNGGISAYPNVGWVCSVGLAQFAIIAHKLRMPAQASAAVSYLLKAQNNTGGFFGSYGLRAKYFSKEEISWANKFFLDALHLVKGPIPQPNEGIAKLDAEQWHEAMVGETIDEISQRLQKNNFAIWCRPLLEQTEPGDSVLELGSGTGELAAILSKYGRDMHLLDYSSKSIEYGKALFQRLGLQAQFYEGDVLNDFPLPANAVDWVFSSGVLEHFTDEQIIAILKKSAAVARKGVMSLVPNSQSLFYAIGKRAQERAGTWAYGKEIPKPTMRPYFEAAGLKDIQEHSVGTYHALKFFGKDNEDIRRWLDELTPLERQALNQGYLWFTYGKKNA